MSRVVLVTGCSSGFGHHIASTFAARGDQVIATVRREATIAGLRDEFAASGYRDIDVRQLDVTDTLSVSSVAEEITGVRRGGRAGKQRRYLRRRGIRGRPRV